MKDTGHCSLEGVVVRVDRFWVVRPASRVRRSSGGQEELDGFVTEDQQRRHCSERFVSAGVTDYSSRDALVGSLDTEIIGPAEARFDELIVRKAETMKGQHV